jgi:hypothetical protein
VGHLYPAEQGSSVSFECAIEWLQRPDAFAIDPMDRARINKTSISEDQEEPSVAGALAAGVRFGLNLAELKKILREVYGAVSEW